jgi:hypothetical protein
VAGVVGGSQTSRAGSEDGDVDDAVVAHGALMLLAHKRVAANRGQVLHCSIRVSVACQSISAVGTIDTHSTPHVRRNSVSHVAMQDLTPG